MRNRFVAFVIHKKRKTIKFSALFLCGSFEDTVRGTVVWIELVRQNLRLSESFALLLYTKAGDRLGLSVFDYAVAKDTKFSATTLLKMNNSPVSAKQFNRLMLEHRLLEKKRKENPHRQKTV